MLLEGKKAIITGGTRGIGYAIAARFIEEGASVTVFGSRQETANHAVDQLLATYPEAKVWGRTCDLASLDAVTEAFHAAAEDMGGVDTIVNNAGISQSTPLLDYTADEWQKVMDLNVTAVFNGCRAGAQLMIEAGHGGTITHHQLHGLQVRSALRLWVSDLQVRRQRPHAEPVSRACPQGHPCERRCPGVTKTDMVAALPEEVINRSSPPSRSVVSASPRTSPMPLSTWRAT